MRVAAVQLRSGTEPERNVDMVVALVREAADLGATYVQTPEITNIAQRRKAEAEPFVVAEEADPVLAALRALAAERGIHVHIGSLVVREGDRRANRALLIGPDGSIKARYDKIHMFDVDLPDGETFRESHTFAPGGTAVVVPVDEARLGISICFDVRFPALYAALSEAGANLLSVPAAFAVSTGRAHWHVLTRARAIENACFLIAAAQEGEHEDGRRTYGHSVIIDPWGRILAEAEETPSVITADLDLSLVDTVRAQVPVITARRTFAVEQLTGEQRQAS